MLLLLVVTLLSFSLLIAQDETELDQAYACLKDKLGNDCGNTQSTEQAAFSILAMSDDSSIVSDCKSSLQDKERTDCWGETASSSCDLKSTSLAILALDFVGSSIDDNIDWLLGERIKDTGLSWFLEVDSNNATTCKIEVDNVETTFLVGEDKKISGSSSCLTPAEQDYFLQISNSCINKNFTISCDKDFITTLIYKKPGDDIYHVSSKTHSAPAHDYTEEGVESYCFGIGNTCDYEGSLWAALALGRAGEDVTPYIPYIYAMSNEPENKKYLPSAFLFMLTNEDDYLSELIGSQRQSQYWDESGDRLYDTALALLSLQNTNVEERANAEAYLFSIQESSGCWTSNTAFIIYALNPGKPTTAGVDRSYCEDFDYYCVSPLDCSLGDNLDNFYCTSLSDVCCETQPEQETCNEKQGIICESDQRCTIAEVPASDTSFCCLGSCQLAQEENRCEELGYVCNVECPRGEEEKESYSSYCDYGEICCAEKTRGGGFGTIFILIILIVLVVLAILYRNQLKIWIFRTRSGFKIKKPPRDRRRPGPPPSAPMIRPGPAPHRPAGRPVRRPMPRRMQRPQREREFEETMRKLREMSK